MTPRGEITWTSLLFEDFEYLPDPRRSPDYEDEMRAFLSQSVQREFRELQPTSTAQPWKALHNAREWPLLRCEWLILQRWSRWGVGEFLGTRIETHTVRYLSHLVSSLDPDPWFQEKVWSFYDTRSRDRQVTNWFGAQNCLAPETRVRMSDGSVCRADEVEVGDQLMGDDSKPRNVLSICEGRAPMYRVTPKVGKPFICTENHLITVIRKRARGSQIPGEILDIPASEVATYPPWKMDNFGLFSVETEYIESKLEIDPYIYGIWLGDGDTSGPVITTADEPVIKDWREYWEGKGYVTKTSQDKRSKAIRVYTKWPHHWKHSKSPARQFFRDSVSGSKFIRPEYLLASVEQRLQLLAGLIDADGFLTETYYDIASSNPQLAAGIETLAQSLGFRVSRRTKKTNFEGCPTEKMSICGDLARIPVRLDRRRKTRPVQGKGVRKHGVTGFTVENIGIGPYAGFMVDGNHRYLLEDYTVVHNSGKTMTMSVLACGLGALHSAYTRSTLSGPFKDAGESPLWSETQSVFGEIKEEWGDDLALWTGARFDPKTKKFEAKKGKIPCMMSDAESKGILRFSDAPKAGTIRLIAMDKVGKTQGAKAKDRKQQEGYFLMFLDEIGAGYATMEFLRMLHNLQSNDNLHVFTGCNPINPIGQLDGELGRPTSGFESLKIDESYVWNSGHGSRTYRFDGHRSPNIILGENRWPWLFNEKRKNRLLASTAVDSDFYNAQCRGFMPMGSGTKYVLTVPDIRQGAVDQPFEWSPQAKWRVAFLDPALSTNGDNAVYTLLEGGTRRLPDQPVIYAAKQNIFPIFTGMIATPEWVRKCQAVRGQNDPKNHQVGQMIPVEEQLAILSGFQLLLDQVPFEHFAYDDSMRSKVMEAMLWAMGDKTKPVSSVGDPEDIPMYPPQYSHDEKGKRHLVTWRQDCQKFVSQMWFFGAAVVRSGFFRCHHTVMPALNQGCQRIWSYAAGGKKRVVESKVDMKARNNGESPDNADSLFGAIYNANRLGLMKLKVDLPNAKEHLTPRARPTPIMRQWTTRKPTTGLFSTGTR